MKKLRCQCAIAIGIATSHSIPSTGFILNARSGGSSSIHYPYVSNAFVLDDDRVQQHNDVVVVDGRELCISSSSSYNGLGAMDTTSLRRRSALSFMFASFSSLAFIWAALFDSVVAFADDTSSSSSSSLSSSAVEEPRECRNGAVVSESAVPGAYQQTCMDLDERIFRLESSGDAITVYQGTKAAGGMAGRTGVAVWNSGILLTRLLDKLCQSNSSIFKNKTILELGCGTGLASIAVAKLGASSVIATDANPEVLALSQRNLERNNLSDVATTVALQWGLLDATEYENSADVIIGSDLTYNSGSWVALAETMSTILKPEGIVIYLTLGHSGFNVGGELGGFISVAENTGLRLLTKDSKEWKENIGNRSIDDVLSSVVTPGEKSVIDANGGVKVVILGKKTFNLQPKGVAKYLQ